MAEGDGLTMHPYLRETIETFTAHFREDTRCVGLHLKGSGGTGTQAAMVRYFPAPEGDGDYGWRGTSSLGRRRRSRRPSAPAGMSKASA